MEDISCILDAFPERPSISTNNTLTINRAGWMNIPQSSSQMNINTNRRGHFLHLKHFFIFDWIWSLAMITFLMFLGKHQIRLNSDFMKTYFRRRNLLLALLASEYDRWVVWYDPLNFLTEDLAEVNETKLPAWMNQLVTPKMLREYAKYYLVKESIFIQNIFIAICK